MECGRSVLAERPVQLLDLALPGKAMAMDDLGEERFRRRTEVEDLLALQVEPAALAGDLRQPRGTVLGMEAVLALLGHADVLAFEASGDDAHALRVQPQHPGDADRLGRHRVTVAL